MSRVAVIGSCITRDLWPIMGEAAPQDLLYISRTSLASLFAGPLRGVQIAEEPPGELAAFPHRAMACDLRKAAIATLVAHRPTHIIFDFIDERLDLVAAGGTVVTHSWELDVSGYLAQDAFASARTIRRDSAGCELLWRQGLAELSAFLAATPLAEARLILHRARWAEHYLDESGELTAFEPEVEIFTGKSARIEDQNAMLDAYHGAFVETLPQVAQVAAAPDLVLADARHRWGLSPFHYVEDYYRDVWRQLRTLGI